MAIRPKISIIIPVYNVELYIADCLQSVIRQTYSGKVECIIVDDCSIDKSVEIVEERISEYNGPIAFKVLHHEHNRGLSAARNTGVEAAMGDYVFFLDSDDYISDDCIEVLSRPLQEYDYDMVLGDLETFGLPFETCWLSHGAGPILGKEVIFRELCVERSIYVMAWNKLIKTSLFFQSDMSFLEGQLHEDELWTYKCSLCLQTVFVCKDVTYHYRIRESGIMKDASYGKERLKRTSRLDTLKYVLAHPNCLDKRGYDEVVASCFLKYWGMVELKGGYVWGEYNDIRTNNCYLPQRNNVLKKHLNRLHWFMPPIIGYVFLLIWNATRKH